MCDGAVALAHGCVKGDDCGVYPFASCVDTAMKNANTSLPLGNRGVEDLGIDGLIVAIRGEGADRIKRRTRQRPLRGRYGSADCGRHLFIAWMPGFWAWPCRRL